MAQADTKTGCWDILKNSMAQDGYLEQHVRFFGIMQILLGIVQVCGGIVLAVSVPYSPAVKTATPWWTGILSIISGSCAVHCAESPTEQFKTTTLVINAISITGTLISICLYSMSTSLTLLLISDFLPVTPLTLTCILICFSVCNMFMTVPVCLTYYKHHPKVRRYHHR
ncbi:membrane-spanning 4-domains subfamily A member 18-like [Heterodontus francisci]|uniref:membrane-spanning 4-domains subfamily A member 18-like n=1 Tax=Heterodontus francisci TaxID=7792 RepID=UPI00355B1CAE